MAPKSRSLIIGESASADLDSIYEYIAEDSPEIAAGFIKQLVADIERIARLGVIGVARDGLRPGLRMHGFGRYCAYFRVADRHMIVVRVLHGARDLDGIDFEPDGGSSGE